MPANHRNAARSAKEQSVWDGLFLEAWKLCLTENGLKGALGCAGLAREAADAAFAQRRESATGKQS